VHCQWAVYSSFLEASTFDKELAVKQEAFW